MRLCPFPGRKEIFAIFLMPVFFLSSGTSPDAWAQTKVKAVATLFPLQEFARMVGGDRVQADLILPPGAEPHAWEPKPSDLAKIYKADVFILIGRVMEPWADDLLKTGGGGKLKVVEALKGLQLLQAGSHSPQSSKAPHPAPGEKTDPHVWLDFSQDKTIVDAILSAFAEIDPAHASQYRANASLYQERLEALDRKYQSSLARCRHRQMVLGGHSAFAYLARRYGLQQIPLYGISPNSEPTPKKLAEVITLARNHGVKYIFFEELVNPKLAKVLAKEAGIQTLVISDGANLTRDQLGKKVDFLSLMEKNLETLRKGLECEP